MSSRWLPGAGGAPDARMPRPGANDVDHLSTGHGEEEFSDPELPLPYGLRASAGLLRRAGPGLARLPVAVRIAGLSRVARSWLDRSDALRQEALAALPEELGFTEEMVSWALDAAFSVITAPALAAWWEREGSQGAQARPGLSGHIWSGNVFVAGLPPVIGSLLAGVPALIKAPSAHPSFAALFARSLALHAPELGPCVGSAAWPRTDGASTDALLGAEVAFVFGDDATVAAVRAVAPDGCAVHGFGHRLSVGLVAGALDDTALRGLLVDVLAYDGGGCLTPRWVLAVGSMEDAVARARRAARLAPEVALALRATPLSDARAAARAQYVGVAGFGGFAAAGAGWCVSAQPGLEPAPPPRTLCFVPIASVAAASSVLAPLGGILQGLAVAGVERDEVAGLAAQGVSIVAAAGELQRPPLAWNHDGVRLLAAITGRR